MKIINRFLILLMLAVPFAGFTGCDDDDDGDTIEVKNIAGTYAGPIKMANTSVVNDARIVVTYVSDAKVTLNMNEEIPLPETSPLPIDVLPVEVSADCAVKVKGSTAEIQEGTSNISLDLTGTGTPVSIPVTISGTIDDTGKANINISLSINLGEIPIPISVKFEGTKMTK